MHIILTTRALFLKRVLLLTAGGLSVFYTSTPPTRAATLDSCEMATSSPDFEAWDAAVRAHVRPTEIRGIGLNSVDYQGMRNDPNFDKFLNSLKNATTTGLGKNAEYALWINTYNALAIRMVNDNPCKKSCFGLKKSTVVGIREVGTLISPVWKKPAGLIGGETVSLDEIEHAKLRAPKGYPADPLLHACIVCASVSCPDVAPKAYKPETLQADMEENMRLFLTNRTKGLSLDKAANVITLSKVFLWFAEDFTTKVGNASVLDTLLPFMPEDVRTYVSAHKADLKINHFEYDWGLNGPPPGAPGKNGRC